VHVTFGEPLRPEEGEKVAQFSERIAKEVRSLYDFTTSYRDDHA
jgi:1-acyl-sn-glycerol-3-phosphate acyltransferase